MASKQFFDPLTLLRVAPLVTSTCSLWYCVDQDLFLGQFVKPHNREKGKEILPGYWKTFLSPGLAVIFGLYGASLGAGVANALRGRPAVSRFYAIGAAFTAAHFLFVPLVMPKIQGMVDDEPKGQACEHQQGWLKVHRIRSLVVDLPGWLCFLAAALESVKAI
ncbi:uncharacterized protein E0L32_001383 [Thyridium curvatum]|uniref:Integral membrane protein n=1 Tax=Thyridium curvatum TaxID=1093900 RepID=A0A507AU06_9PEZI|nr:uncharacterized protein E0L32_001383 [Thyridium curvatum]TPX10186.1 hypothetical protein E0L32_001383 [Thyridium curvatum]